MCHFTVLALTCHINSHCEKAPTKRDASALFLFPFIPHHIHLHSTMTMMCRPLTLLSLLVVCLVYPVVSFTALPRAQRCSSSSSLHLLEDEGKSWIGQPTIDTEHDSFHRKLRERKEELKRGIGKRFIVRTQKGFLNVHSSLDLGPHATDNIVNQLHDGQVVTSKNIVGYWIQHEGGWSVARYGGFVFLQPLEE